MDLLKLLDEKEEQFSELQNKIKEKESEIIQILDEQKRLQGEHRILLQLAKESGVIDEEGRIVNKEE